VNIVELRGVSKRYGDLVALDDVSVDIPAGRFLAVMGPSGSGKSTLLNCAAGLDTPTEGAVTLAGVDITTMRQTERTVFRRQHVGFVFQAYNLLPGMTIRQNILLPLRLAKLKPDRGWVDELVERVGLTDRLDHRPHELSGGQQQRAALVRALAARPEVVFADEPTGALDLRSRMEVLQLLRGVVVDLGQTVVMVTHDPAAAAEAQTVLVMADGRPVDLLSAPSADSLAKRLTELGARVVLASAP
jgi:putative ABC transport system ATP-binding protein